MKKTREAWREKFERLKNCGISFDGWLDEMVEEGWIEVDKPREFWIQIQLEPRPLILATTDTKPDALATNKFCDEIIHVREVIE